MDYVKTPENSFMDKLVKERKLWFSSNTMSSSNITWCEYLMIERSMTMFIIEWFATVRTGFLFS